MIKKTTKILGVLGMLCMSQMNAQEKVVMKLKVLLNTAQNSKDKKVEGVPAHLAGATEFGAFQRTKESPGLKEQGSYHVLATEVSGDKLSEQAQKVLLTLKNSELLKEIDQKPGLITQDLFPK